MKKTKGFTLIEMMVVVAIIAILAAVAMNRLAGLVNKSKEGATREALSSLRSVLSIYYGSNTFYPSDDLACLIEDGRYISQIPPTKLSGAGHADSRNISVGASTAAALTDAGGWAYVNDPDSPSYGTLFINCSHADLSGRAWDGQ